MDRNVGRKLPGRKADDRAGHDLDLENTPAGRRRLRIRDRYLQAIGAEREIQDESGRSPWRPVPALP